MANSKYRAWAEVDLGALTNNLKEIRRVTRKGAKIMAIVKADAYGHGYLEVTKTLLEGGADALGVAFLDEALQLRARGIRVPILILGATHPKWAADLVENDIIPTVIDAELPRAISAEARRQGKTAKIHIKIDTGMNRIGFRFADGDTPEKILEIAALPNIEVEGIFTHFARADEREKSHTKLQFERFMAVCAALSQRGLDIPVKHCCNSAGLIEYPEMHLDMVRPGIILYGLYPSQEVCRDRLRLMPAMELFAGITNIKSICAGESVSYGGAYTAKEARRVATLPIGYADGYARSLGDRAAALVGGAKVRVIGKICMDQCMLDVTNVKNINVGDSALLFGQQNNLSIPVEEIAGLMGTINYEVLCVIGRRIPRVYIQDGKIVEILKYLV